MRFNRPAAILIIFGMALRFAAGLWPEGYGSDELAQLSYAGLPWIELLTRDNNPPLYAIFLKIWLSVFPPESEPVIRLLSTLTSCVTLLLVRRIWRSPWVLAAFALNPASISFASDVKNSALFELGIVLFFGSCYLALNVKNSEAINRHQSPFLSKPVAIFIGASAMITTSFISAIPLAVAAFVLLPRWTEQIKRFRLPILVFGSSSVFAAIVAAIWLRPAHLTWMGEEYAKSPFESYLLIFYAVGSYSYALTLSTIAVILVWWRTSTEPLKKDLLLATAFCTLLYILIPAVLGMSIGYRRFLIPLQVLVSICSGLAVHHFMQPDRFQKSARIAASVFVLLFCFINLKKFTEDLIWSRSAWKQAAANFCNSNEKHYIWGHSSLIFYFDRVRPGCAEVRMTLSEGSWLVSNGIKHRLELELRNAGFQIEAGFPKKLPTDSYESIWQYKAQVPSRFSR